MRKQISALVAMLLVVAGAMFALAVTAGPANAAEPEFSTDPDNPTLVEEVPDGFTLDSATSSTDDCITTEESFYSRVTDDGEGTFSDWTEWEQTQSGLLQEPDLPANTDTHEYRVTGPVEVGNGDATEGHYTEWANEGEPVQGATAPGADTDTVRWIKVGETIVVVDFEGQHYSLKGNSGIEKDEVPVFPADYWQANTTQEPHDNGAGDPVTWLGTPGSGLHYASHGSSGKRDWFYYDPPRSHDEFLWQKQVRSWVPGTPETTHQEWGVEERTRTFTPGPEGFVEYVFTSVTSGEECPPNDNPPNDNPPNDNPPNNPPTGPTPTSVDAGLSSMPTADQSTAKYALLAGSGLLVMLAAGVSLVATRRVGTEK